MVVVRNQVHAATLAVQEPVKRPRHDPLAEAAEIDAQPVVDHRVTADHGPPVGTLLDHQAVTVATKLPIAAFQFHGCAPV